MRRAGGIGRWVVMVQCPTCRDLLVAARVSGPYARCGACGCLSLVIAEGEGPLA